PVIVVICDNGSIHHARKVTAYIKEHPRLGLLYGARYSPDNNPAERIWAALTNYVANTAVSWPARGRSTLSAAAAHRTRCWPPPRPGPVPGCRPVTSRTFGMPPSWGSGCCGWGLCLIWRDLWAGVDGAKPGRDAHHWSGRSTTGAVGPVSMTRASRSRKAAIPEAPCIHEVPGGSSGWAWRCLGERPRAPARAGVARSPAAS